MSSDAEAEPVVKRPLTGGAAMGAVSRVSVAITGALTTIAVARLLGPDGTGGFAIGLTIIYVLTVLTTLGVEHGVAYYVGRGSWAPRHAFATVFKVAAVVGATGAAIGVLARVAAPGPFGDLTVGEVALAACALPFALAWFYASYVSLADDHYEGFVLPPAVQSATGLAFVVGLAVPFGVTGAIAGLFAAHALTAVFTFTWGGRRLGDRPGADDEPRQLHRAIRFGIKGYAANALQTLNYRVDVFILAALAPAATVGTYSVALGATAALWLLPQALSDVLFPRVAALGVSDHADAEHHERFVITKSLRHTTLIVVVGALVLAVALWLLIVPVYGADFEPAIDLSLILIPGVCLLGIAGVLSAVIIGRGRPEYGLYTALISTPLTMVLYALLIPPYEATGAAWATTLSFTTNFVLACVFFHRVTGMHVLPMLVPTRSEFHDYRGLPPQIRAWLAARRSGAGASTT